jgi:hypothetical protein
MFTWASLLKVMHILVELLHASGMRQGRGGEAFTEWHVLYAASLPA